MGRREDALALYRRGLRLSRQMVDPCGRNYLVNRVMSVFRRYKNEVSEQIITRHLHDGRQAVRRLGKVMAGDRDSIRYVLELAYGKRGRVKHILANAVVDGGKKKGPLYALSVIKDPDAVSAVLRAAMSRVPAQTWNGRVIPRQRSAAAAANGDGDGAPAASRAETSSQAESSSSHQPPATHPSHALAVAWEAALWQSVSLKAWRGLLSASGPAAPQEPAVYRTVPPPGAIRYAPWPRFSPDWEERHLQLLKRVFLPALPDAVKVFPRDHRRMYEGIFELERMQAKIIGLPDKPTAGTGGESSSTGCGSGGPGGVVQVLFNGRPMVSFGGASGPELGKTGDSEGETCGSDAAAAGAAATRLPEVDAEQITSAAASEEEEERSLTTSYAAVEGGQRAEQPGGGGEAAGNDSVTNTGRKEEQQQEKPPAAAKTRRKKKETPAGAAETGGGGAAAGGGSSSSSGAASPSLPSSSGRVGVTTDGGGVVLRGEGGVETPVKTTRR